MDYDYDPVERLHDTTSDKLTRAICRVYLGRPLSDSDRAEVGVEYTQQDAGADLDDIFESDRCGCSDPGCPCSGAKRDGAP